MYKLQRPRSYFIYNIATDHLRWLLCCIVLLGINLQDGQAQTVFDTGQLHEIKIYTSASQSETWYSTLQNYYDSALAGAKQRYIAVACTIDGQPVAQTGFRFKGKYSNYGFPGKKKPFCLDFNRYIDSQTFQGLKRLNLHNNAADPSFLREYMAYRLFAHLRIAAPRASFCKLYINDAYWGCYTIVEEPDKTFLSDRFGNKNGNLFECIKNTALEWRGNDSGLYPEMELKTNPNNESWSKLLAWIKLFNNYNNYDFQQQFSAMFDTETFMKILAVDVLINNWDSYYDNGRNFFIYDDRQQGKLRWIPWDYNLSFWATDPYVIPTGSPAGIHKPLIKAINTNPYLRSTYLQNYCRLIEYELQDFDFENISLSAHELIREAVETDTLKFYGMEAFYRNRTETVTVNMLRSNKPTDVALPGITHLYRKRKNDLRNMLFIEGVDCSEIKKETAGFRFVIFPNPAVEQCTIYIEDIHITNVPVTVYIYDIGGKIIEQKSEMPNKGSIHLNLGNLRAGTYIVEVSIGNTRTHQKLIIHK